MTPKSFCTFLFVLLCIVSSIHCDTFYINAAADSTSTDCSEPTPCQSFSQVITTFPDATAYDLNVAPGVYSGNGNVGLAFTVPVTIQPYSSNGQNGTVIIDAGTFAGAVISATNSVAITGITMLADATTTARAILLSVNSLQPLTLQQVNFTTTGPGIGIQVHNATNITLSGSFVTSSAINITAGASVTVSNTVFASTAYPAVALYNVPSVVIDSSQFNFAEVITSYCNEITLSNSVFNSPPNTVENFASFFSEYGQNMHVNNVSMAVTESAYLKYGLTLPSLLGNLTIDSFQLSGPYSDGIVANGTSATISNVNITDTTASAMVMQVSNFYLSQFYFSNCTLGVSYLGQSTSAIINEGIVNNAFLFAAKSSTYVSAGEISNVQIQITADWVLSGSTSDELIALSSGSWVISNLTATSTVAQSINSIIYGGTPSANYINVTISDVHISGFSILTSALGFFETPGINLVVMDSTFSNLSQPTSDAAFAKIIDAISARGALIYIDNCVFSDSSVAAFAAVNSALVDIRNSVFSNTSLPPTGSMLLATATITSAASVSIANNTFIGNSFNVGALSITYSSAAVVSNCTFSNNVGNSSGGLYSTETEVINVSGCSFTNNTVQKAGYGGAILASLYFPTQTNTTSITDSTFTGNYGNGVYLSGGTGSYSWPVSVSDLTFNDNTENAIICVNQVTVEYQGTVTIDGEDSKDDISGCTITDSSDDGNGWVWTAILIAVIVVVAVIILIIVGAIVAAVVIMKRKRSSYVALDDE